MLENTFRKENFILNLGQVNNFMSQKDFKAGTSSFEVKKIVISLHKYIFI